MAVTKISLRNFQIHQQIDLDLSSPITSILGKSDCGKSSIIRALRWLLLNKPGGDSFIHHGCEFAKVSICVDDHKIVRSKGKKNLYWIDGKKRVSFGTNVPDDIAEILNISEDNIQQQLDSPFLLGLPPGEVAKKLNSIVDLGLIDKTLAKLSTESRKARYRAEVCRERVEEAKTKKIALKWTLEANENLDKLEKMDKEIQFKETTISELKLLANNLKEAEMTKIKMQEFITEGERIRLLGNKILNLEQKIREALDLMEQIKTLEKDKLKSEKSLENLEKEKSEVLKSQCPICGRSSENN